MKATSSMVLYALLALSMMSCLSGGATDMKPIAGASSFYLDDADLSSLKEKALSGDNAAALRVYRHYEMGKGDPMSSLPWLELAANRSDADAQYILGYTYAHVNLFKNISLAKYWLSEASRNGSAKATALLAELQ